MHRTTATRRDVLAGLVALLAAPIAARAALPEDLDAERRGLLEMLQQRILGFDIAEFGARAVHLLGLPSRYADEWRAALAGFDTARGIRAFQDLDDDHERSARVQAVFDKASSDLRVKLRLRRLARQAPTEPGSHVALVDAAMRELLDLDASVFRAHVDRYEQRGLGIVYGPFSTLGELGGVLGAHWMTWFLELVHGRRATVVHTDSATGVRPTLELALDPEIRVLCTVAHGHWGSLWLGGFQVSPDRAWTRVASRLRKKTREAMTELVSGHLYAFFRADYRRDSLEEADLARLVAQWWPDPVTRAAQAKDLVVRHTCGTRRYTSDADLLWRLLPEELGEQIEVDDSDIAGRRTGDQGPWQAELETWLTDKDVTLTESSAWGTSLVRRPEDTRGYDGLSWLADFVEQPVPPWTPGHEFAHRTPVDALSWLTGCWRRGEAAEECWRREGDRLIGEARSNGAVTESMSIEADGVGLRLTAAPSGQPPASFAAVEVFQDRVRFANPAHDFPNWITYRREGQTLHAAIGRSGSQAPAATWTFTAE